MFSQVCVRPQAGGTPSPSHNTSTGPHVLCGGSLGYPLVRSGWGVPKDGVPLSRSGWGYPRMEYAPVPGWGTPQPGEDGGTRGCSTPHPRMRYPPGWGTLRLGQQREYLLCRGRYASCVHAGGLSCLCF